MTRAEVEATTITKLEAYIEHLENWRSRLENENDDLSETLAHSFYIEPYDMPAEVAEVLINQLAGWPAKRWRELAALIAGYAEVEPCMPPTTPRDVPAGVESDELASKP